MKIIIDCDEVMESLEHVINWKKGMKRENKNRGVKTFHRLPVVFRLCICIRLGPWCASFSLIGRGNN